MSSHRMSVSGERQYTITAGGGPFSSVQYPAKAGDSAVATLQSFDEIAFVLSPGLSLTIEHVRTNIGDREVEAKVLTIRGEEWEHDGVTGRNPAGIALRCTGMPVERNFYPHTNLDVRKSATDGYDPIASALGHPKGEVEVLDTQVILGRDPAPAEGDLTDVALANRVAEDGIAADDSRRPVALAVGDQRTELRARRIVSGNELAKLNGLPVVVDDSLGDGGWELRYANGDASGSVKK